MKKMIQTIRPALICFVVLTIICGIIYTAVITGIAALAFPHQANGSTITVTLKDGTKTEYGSALIEQEFTKPQYLIGRPMAVSNLSPTSAAAKAAVEARVTWWHNFDPTNKADIPADLVAGSGSGFDPNISIAAADYQIARIAKARNISQSDVEAIISKYTTGRFLGIFGEPAVNVLKVNLALEGLL